jgi:uncharacterized protein (TIGR02996 family)
MTQDEAFLQAILENPNDDSPRLIYADWLEERGEKCAAALRAYPAIVRLLASLKTATQAPYDVVERHAAAGLVDFLSALSLLIERGRNLLPNRKWPGILDSMQDHMERILALKPGQASMDALVEGLHARPQTPARIRSIASLLAYGQRRDVLQYLFEFHGSDGRCAELLACLVQEMVLRKDDVYDLTPLVRFMLEMRVGGHPLAQLPLALVRVESELRYYLPLYNATSLSLSLPRSPSRQPGQPLPIGTTDVPMNVAEVIDSASAGRIVAVVRNWQEESNGQVEVRIFRAEHPIAEGELTVQFLRSLGLGALRGAGEEDVRAERIPASRAACILFSAASSGGAYGRGLLGAYGRLEMWRSLAGLVGAASSESVEAVAALAERCTWLAFDAESDWFYHVAWDFGLVAIRPDGMSLAVLAAADTD